MRFALVLAAPLYAAAQASTGPKALHIGYIVFPAFEALDVFGPLDPLNMLSITVPLNLSIIGPSLSPVSTKLQLMQTPSWFNQSIIPTHTFANPPENLDVLIPPIDLIRNTYPSLKYLISICTGVTLLARAGVLDGRKATGNKAAWAFVKSTGPNVDWVPKARWVVDGNIWSTSGVAAGLDGIFAWIEHVYGEETATTIANRIEYERHTDASWDPFSDIFNTTSAEHQDSESSALLGV